MWSGAWFSCVEELMALDMLSVLYENAENVLISCYVG